MNRDIAEKYSLAKKILVIKGLDENKIEKSISQAQKQFDALEKEKRIQNYKNKSFGMEK